MFDYIIVGQGLAGSILSWELKKRGASIKVLDKIGGSSRIAAGLINPITGRRIVKSWRIDDLMPQAQATYKDLEKHLGINIWHERSILRTFKNSADENEWHLRAAWDDYRPFCAENADPSVWQDKIEKFVGFGEILQSAHVNLPLLLDTYRTYLIDNEELIDEEFDFNNFTIEEHFVIYKGIVAQKIIFADGAKGAENPFFDWLPWNLDKGECLIAAIEDFPKDKIFKHNFAIVPMPDTQNSFWVGATNEWKSSDELPTENKKTLIVNELENVLKTKFSILEHRAAFRPTVKDRRPFIGLHPNFRSLAIFNGFGTKGTSLVPYFAVHFADALYLNTPLDSEVNIERFL